MDTLIPPVVEHREHMQKQVSPDDKTNRRFLPFFFKALTWASLTYLLGKEFAAGRFWIVVVSVILFSVPIGLCGIYGNTIRQIHLINSLISRGHFYRWYSRRLLMGIVWVLWALGTSFFMLIQFHTYNILEWVVFFLVIPVFWLTYCVIRRIVVSEWKPYLVTNMALEWSRRFCALIMLVIYVLLTMFLSETPEYASLQDAVIAQQAMVADMTGSAVVFEVSQYLAIYDGFKAYAFGHIGAWDALLAMVILGIGGYVVFFNACAILSCFLIPRVEFRRVFGPLSDADQPRAITPLRIAAIFAVTTFLALFIYLPLFAYIEGWVRQTPEVARIRQNTESLVILRVEKIDDAYFKEGTFAQLQDARIDALHEVDVSLAHLEGQADRAFDRIEANVDGYLDWYYSLAGEYSRIGKLLIGEIEEYMTSKLAESLQQGDAFKEIQFALNNALAVHDTAQMKYRQAAQAIMNQNRIDLADLPVNVVQLMSLKDVLNPPVHKDIVSLKGRLLAGGGGAAVAATVTAVATKKIIGKIVGKNVLKVAAKALAKVVVSKTAGTAGGAAAGAAAGAAVGSIVPGPGNGYRSRCGRHSRRLCRRGDDRQDALDAGGIDKPGRF